MKKLLFITLCITTFALSAIAGDSIAEARLAKLHNFASRFSLGGYGEAVMTRNFYSDHINRYKMPENYAGESHGRFDLPHVVINLGFDFGKGWTLGSEIEFEHGGNGGAVEMDADESGEYEAEVEKGGEVNLEQVWIQKSFMPQLNVRMGEIIVPVGATNQYHMPTEFFTCYRPEGENTLFPCTWHQLGVSLWGRAGKWRYEALFLSGLNADQFGAQSFVHYGATSPYEFKIANTYATAVRIDNYTVSGLRIGLSGYYGTSLKNSLTRAAGARFAGKHGGLAIGAIDFTYDNHRNIVARGNFDYAHLSDADDITYFNQYSFATHKGQDGQPSKHQPVASTALCGNLEIGYDFFSLSPTLAQRGQRLFLFAHYEYYNSMASGTYKDAYQWCGKHRVAVGLNYYPMKQIVLKGEYSNRLMPASFNNEPSISLSVAYCGWFL